MLAAVNSKRKQYDPMRYMMNGRALKQQRARRAEQPMTGDQVLARIRQLGVPVIDNRSKVS
jgi:hypothetical protein